MPGWIAAGMMSEGHGSSRYDDREERILMAKKEVLKVFEEAAREPGIDGMDAAVINTVATVVAKAVERALEKVL